VLDRKTKSIASFRDLQVYQKSYVACIEVMSKIIPNLPDSEKFDLKKRLSSSVKAIPRLIAEGYAKRH
jgi:four helix bundle protein